MHYTCIRISKGSAKKTHFFTVGGGGLGYMSILPNIYNICHFHRSYNEFPESHSVWSGVPIIQREAIQSCAKRFKAKRRLDSDAQCSTLPPQTLSTHHMLDCVLYGRAAGKCSIICSTHSLKPAAERCASELITCPTLQASIQCVKHLSKCKRTWPIFLLLLSPLLFISCSLFNTEPVFIPNVQRHITLAFAGLVRLIPELVFREICKSP